ncbi:hypothetical protein ABHI18_011160 [Aspergillus niger]
MTESRAKQSASVHDVYSVPGISHQKVAMVIRENIVVTKYVVGPTDVYDIVETDRSEPLLWVAR